MNRLLKISLSFVLTCMSLLGMGLSSPHAGTVAQAAANLLANGDFENGLQTPWISWNTAGVVLEGAYEGKYSAYVTQGSSLTQTVNGLSPNTTYILKAESRTQLPNDTVAMSVKNYGGNEVARTVNSTLYQEYDVVFTTGAANTSAQIVLYKSGTTLAGKAYFDDLQLMVSPIQNSNFESGATGPWVPWNHAGVSNAQPYEGTFSAYATPSSSLTQTISGLSPNTTYTLSAFAMVQNQTGTATIGVKNYGGVEITSTVNTTNYQLYQVEFTTGATNTQADIVFYNSGAWGSGNANADAFRIEPKIDFDAIKLKMQNNLLQSLNASTLDPAVKDTLSHWKADGNFDNVLYTVNTKSTFGPITHLDNVQRMASAYDLAQSVYYHDSGLLQKIFTSLDYWAAHDFSKAPANHWYYDIGTPGRMANIFNLIPAGLSQTTQNTLLSIAERGDVRIQVLRYGQGSYNGDPNRATALATGANLTDLAKTSYAFAIFAKDRDDTQQITNIVNNETAVMDKGSANENEGVMADNSFHQHLSLFYSGHYGLGFALDIAQFLSNFQGSPFQLSDAAISNIANYALDGEAWMFLGNYQDDLSIGRFASVVGGITTGMQSTLNALVTAILQVPNPPRKTELQNLLNSRLGSTDPGFSGSKVFWLSDYTSHNRPGYHIGVLANSTRTKPSESMNGQGIKQYYLADGATNVLTRSQNYNNVFPVWDWNKVPGTTTPQGALVPLSGVQGGYSKMGNTTFVGGVSDGEQSVMAMDYNKDNVQAKISWFFSNEGMMALGAGIAYSTNPNHYSVATSVEQAPLIGSIAESDGSVVQTLTTGNQSLNNVLWFLHNGIGYYFPGQATVQEKNGQQSGVWYAINRGDLAVAVPNGDFAAVDANSLPVLAPWTAWNKAGINSSGSGYTTNSSSLTQTVTGLQPNTDYALAFNAYKDTSADVAQVSVKDYGGTEVIQPIDSTSKTDPATALDTAYTLYFHTGASNTSATIVFYKAGGSGSGEAYADNFKFVKVQKQNVFSLWLDHGTNPSGSQSQYAYMILPNQTQSSLDQYAKNPNVTILSNTTSLQSVWNQTAHLFQGTFWQPNVTSPTNPDGWTVSTDQPATVMVSHAGTNWVITASDPTQLLGQLTITINRTILGITGATNSNGTTVIPITLPNGNHAGQSLQVTGHD